MSRIETKEFLKKNKQELAAELQGRFPQLTINETEDLATDVENAGLSLIDQSVRHGIAAGFAQAQKANKVSMAIRTVVVTILAPLFVTVGAKVAGQNSFGLMVGGVCAAFVFYIADEAVSSLTKLFKREK